MDTLGHVRRGCRVYADLQAGGGDQEFLNLVEKSEVFYEAVLARRLEIKLSDAALRGGA